jgi:hypothetical protein
MDTKLSDKDEIADYYKNKRKFTEQKELIDCMVYLCGLVIVAGIVFATVRLIQSFF